VCAIDADPGLWLDIEHDDHAQVSIMSDVAFALLETIYLCDDRVSGVVPGADVAIKRRGILKLEMSRAMVVSGASRLLASGPELRERYYWQASGSKISYTHKVSCSTLVFRCDTVRKNYHILVNVSSLGAEICDSISMIPLLLSLCPMLSSPPYSP
jgi:hypothetical protein